MKRNSGAPTKEKLIEAATELMAEDGFHATSVQSIVDAAGATKGAFYHHFESKDDVLIAIFERFNERRVETLREIIDEGSPSAAFAKIVEELTAAQDSYGREIRILSRDGHYLRKIASATVRTAQEEVERLIVRAIDRGIKEGEFEPVQSAQFVAFGVFGMTTWLHQWYAPGGPMRAREIGRMYGSLLLDGMRAR
jgi:TetR/AcrR family transcriptional regulator, cholesterol catabolism regulator